MCLAIPMTLVECNGLEGTVELDGVRRKVGLVLCPEARAGEQVLVHAGYAIGVLDADEAARTLELIHEALHAEEAAGGAPHG